MKYLGNVKTEEELRQTYRNLAKKLHPDVSSTGDAVEFKILLEEYTALQKSFEEAKANAIDFNSEARVIASVIKEAVAPFDGCSIRLDLRGSGVDVIIGNECGMKTIMAVYTTIQGVKDQLEADIEVFMGRVEKDEMIVMYPIMEQGDWIFISKKVPASMGKAESIEVYKGRYFMQNKKYTWVLDTKTRKCYVFEGDIATMKKIMK